MLPTRSPDCKELNHGECLGMIERTEWDKHDRTCMCYCHNKQRAHSIIGSERGGDGNKRRNERK